MPAYVINIMVVLIIFRVILQTDINVIMLSIGGQETIYNAGDPRIYNNHKNGIIYFM